MIFTSTLYYILQIVLLHTSIKLSYSEVQVQAFLYIIVTKCHTKEMFSTEDFFFIVLIFLHIQVSGLRMFAYKSF